MMFQEIRIEDIPAIAFLKGTKSNLYVGPKLSWWKRRRLRKVESKYNVVYPYELFETFTRESFEYNFPGIPYPESFSVEAFYEAIRRSVGNSLTAESYCFIRHDGESFVVYIGDAKLKPAISYLIQNGDKFKPAPCEDEIRFRTAVEEEVVEIVKPHLVESKPEEIDEEGLKLEETILEDKVELVKVEEQEKPEEDIRFRVCAEEEFSDTLFKTRPNKEEIDRRQRELDKILHPQPAPPPNSDERFDSEMIKAAADVKQAIEELLMSGYPIEIIRSWVNEPVKLSRLRITRQFKIILPDYNKEIKMGPLPKAVFLFYLRHPEGVMFSHLQDHVKELKHIYEHVSVNDDPQKISQSIKALINPFNNSICEKCAAIKKAFITQMTNEIAQNYYVTGMQGGAKGIALDRKLVKWECKL